MSTLIKSLFVFWATTFLFQTASATSLDLFEIERVVDSSVQYLAHSQIKANTHHVSMSGEWKNFIYFNGISVGKRKSGSYFLDSNSFVTSSVYELLAGIYDTHPQKYPILIDVMNLAVAGLSRYESNGTFNFWPKLTNSLMKGPIHLPLQNSFEKNFTNIVNDSDDTALAFRALTKHKKYSLEDERFTSPFYVPLEMQNIFDEHRDHGRKKSHYYNNKIGDPKNSGAFLTWFGNETAVGARSLVSWLPIEKQSTIPFKVNDVDCVANGNVLTTLALNGSLEKSKGAQMSCRYINQAIKRGQSKECGSYYPSEFTLHYTVTKAINAGADCLIDSLEIIKNEILSGQNSDGRFVSSWHGNESIQSTAYALSALLNIHKLNKTVDTQLAIHKAVSYLLTQKNYDDEGNIYWKGGAFFSGGSIIRKKILWVSDAYTTALIAAALNSYIEENKNSKQTEFISGSINLN